VNRAQEIAQKIQENGGIEHAIVSRSEFLVLMAHVTPHECKGSLMRCCDIFRCEPCHIAHMRLSHRAATKQTWEKFTVSQRIVKEEIRVERPLPVPKAKEVVSKHKSQKIAKVRFTPEMIASIRQSSPTDVLDAIVLLQEQLHSK